MESGDEFTDSGGEESELVTERCSSFSAVGWGCGSASCVPVGGGGCGGGVGVRELGVLCVRGREDGGTDDDCVWR